MKKNKLLFLALLILVFSSIEAKSQNKITVYSNTIVQLDSLHQGCLDKGEEMLGCSEKYFFQMDSMLNVVYKDLVKCFPDRKPALKQEQLNWLKKRDKEFIKIDGEKVTELSSYDNQTLALNKKSFFIEERVKVLINKLAK